MKKALLLIIALISLNQTYASEVRTYSEFEEFLTLNEVVFKRAYIFVGKIKIGKAIEATNYEGEAVCIQSTLTKTTNVRSEFLNDGIMYIRPGETVALGGFTSIDKTKNWYAKWRHAKKVSTSFCLSQMSKE